MEFTGRIKKVLPLRSGTSQRTGNEWKSLPFIFEYFEHETDRYADSVVLETRDDNVIANLKEGMEVRCGFGHRTNDYEGKTYNELRLYKIECVRGQAANQPAQPQNAPGVCSNQAPTTNESQNGQNQGGEKEDDLPF